MVALYIAVFLISIFSSVIATPGSEGMITLDDVLAEISSMRNDIDGKMSSMKNDIDNKMRTYMNEMSSMRSDMDQVSSMMNKLIRLVEDLRDIHLSPNTTTPTPPTLPPQPSPCRNYTELSDAWRHIDYVNRGNFHDHCDETGWDSTRFTNLTWGSWYRFTGRAGNKLPTGPAPVGGGPDYGYHMCGTSAVAYISSLGNPTIQDGIVTRDVCFEWGSDSCFGKTTVGVAACRDMHGEYFVYQLQPVPGCNFAYCAIE